MHFCDYCGVRVKNGQQNCPLCGRQLTEHKEVNSLYPAYHVKKLSGARRLFGRLAAFCSVAACLVTAVINFFTWPESHLAWSLFVIAPVLCAWLLVGNTLLARRRGGAVILLQTIAFSAMFAIIDAAAGFHRWSVNYVIPFLLITQTLVITIIVYTKKIRWNQYIGYALTMIFLGFAPILLYAVGLCSVLWPSVSSAAYSFLTLAYMFVFSNKAFLGELKKRFHF